MKTTEMKIYEKLGVLTFRKIAFAIKKKYNTLTKTNRNDNYFLKGYHKEDIELLRKEFTNNLIIHLFGTIVGILLMIGIATNDRFYLYRFVLALIIFVVNAYAAMLQRYNLIRIDHIINNKSVREKKMD